MTSAKALVIDTNVLVVANGRAPQADQGCVLRCVDALVAAQRNAVTAVDEGGEIVDEYFRNASRSGQPGVGDAFAKWLFDHQYQAEFCEQVELTVIDGDGRGFVEFPDDPGLAGFDPSDRKFVAVAAASALGPEILEATDTKWWRHRLDLRRHGVQVRFLCPDLMR